MSDLDKSLWVTVCVPKGTLDQYADDVDGLVGAVRPTIEAEIRLRHSQEVASK